MEKYLDINYYNYELDKKYIAQTPTLKRSHSKLLILNKETGKIKHTKFYHIINYLNPGDVLVLNNTKVIPARIYGKKETTGANLEILLLENIKDNKWDALVKNSRRLNINDVIIFKDNILKAKVLSKKDDGIIELELIYEGILYEILDSLGEMPTPPYIHEKLEDNDRYQTVYAKYFGSAAAPTAGLHFTKELLKRIENKGIIITYVTLHVGMGTFKPVSEDNILNHKMHSEYYKMDKKTANMLNEAKKRNSKIISVGTTSTRVLETIYTKYNTFKESSGNTDIFIYPGYEFKAIDSLITNFHLPKSTLMMLVSALAGRDNIMAAYEEAKKHDYRFFSFGDAMFIDKPKKILELLNDFKYLKPFKTINNFDIYKGTSKVMLSAPHAHYHLRENHHKAREYHTDSLLKILHLLTNCHIIFTTSDGEDYNHTKKNIYKEELKKYIKKNDIKFLIDIHGLEYDDDRYFEIGINKYENVNGNVNLINKIYKRLSKFNKKVTIDTKFLARTKTISYYINKETNIPTMQLEIGKNYRRLSHNTWRFQKLVKKIKRVIRIIEREYKNDGRN